MFRMTSRIHSEKAADMIVESSEENSDRMRIQYDDPFMVFLEAMPITLFSPPVRHLRQSTHVHA
jgi:hypothetical protein